MLNKDLQEIEKINNILNKNDKKLKKIIENLNSEYHTFQETKTYLVKEKKLTFSEFCESLEFETINKKIGKLETKEKIIKKFNKVLVKNKYILIEKILLNEVLKMEILKKLDNKKIGEKRNQQIEDNFKNAIEPFLKNFDTKNIYLNLKLSKYCDYMQLSTRHYGIVLSIELKNDNLNLNNLKLLVETKQKELGKQYVLNPYRYVLNSFKNEKLLKKLEKEKELIEEKIYSLKKEIVKY